MHQRLDALGMPHTWKDYGAGCHTVANFQREILDTLAVFERVFAKPPAPPAKFDHRSIEPRFDVWGWHVAADPARALEFMRLEAAGDLRLALTGSGTTAVTTPPTFRGLRAVDVYTPAGRRVVRPDRAGRLRFTVPLGPPAPRAAVHRCRPGRRPGLAGLLHARLGAAGAARPACWWPRAAARGR